MKILIYRWSVFHQEDIAEAFESFGHTVEYYEEMPSCIHFDTSAYFLGIIVSV